MPRAAELQNELFELNSRVQALTVSEQQAVDRAAQGDLKILELQKKNQELEQAACELQKKNQELEQAASELQKKNQELEQDAYGVMVHDVDTGETKIELPASPMVPVQQRLRAIQRDMTQEVERGQKQIIKVKEEKDAELDNTRQRLLETTGGFDYDIWQQMQTRKAQELNEELESECDICMEEDGKHAESCIRKCVDGALLD